MVTKSRSGKTTTLSGNVGTTAAEATIAPTVASDATPPSAAAVVRRVKRRRPSRPPPIGDLNRDLRILPPRERRTSGPPQQSGVNSEHRHDPKAVSSRAHPQPPYWR